jgi:hypothetical protein
MIDPFVFLTPVLILTVMALLRFVGCDVVFGVDPVFLLDFNPPPGGYFSAQTVTLSCTDGGADISFTTDGSDPGSSTTQHFTGSGSILVSATTTIKAVATVTEYGFHHVSSGVYPATYIIGPIMFQQLAEFDDQTNISPNPMAVSTPAAPAPGSFTGSIAQNTLMVVWIYYRGPDDGSITVSSVTDAAGNSYLPAVGPTPQGAEATAFLGHRQEIWYGIIAKTDTGGLPFTVTAHFTAPITVDKAISAHAYTAANSGDPLDKALDMTPNVAGASGLSGAVSAGSVTTTNARLVFAAAVYVGAAGGPGGGFRQRSMLSGNVSEDADVPNPGQVVQATFTPATMPWIAQMCTFK